MPDHKMLLETELAMTARVGDLDVDFAAAHSISSIYRAANAVRAHLTNAVLRPHGLTWTGFVVLWVVWLWDGMETRHVADNAAISKATLTGVVKTLEASGLIYREGQEGDRRLVRLRMTPQGVVLMDHLYPEFNAVESQLVARLSVGRQGDLAESLRTIVGTIESLDPSLEDLPSGAIG